MTARWWLKLGVAHELPLMGRYHHPVFTVWHGRSWHLGRLWVGIRRETH